jgi:acyl dehydratase
MPVTIEGVDGLKAKANTHIGTTEWETMTFDRIQAFADATGDHQWIHVDRERIAKESPFGAPIAHGYFTLSMVAGRFFDLLDLQGMGMVINYGTNKVRFPNPLKEGARFRLAIDLGDVTDKRGGWVEAIFKAAIQIEGEDKPAVAAECVFRFLPAQ